MMENEGSDAAMARVLHLPCGLVALMPGEVGDVAALVSWGWEELELP